MKPMMDQGTLVAAIKRCTTVRDLETIQAYMIRTNFTQDIFLLSKLIESYAITLPIRKIAHAYKLFSWTHQPNLFMWNTIIRGYSINDLSSLKAIALYKDMHLFDYYIFDLVHHQYHNHMEYIYQLQMRHHNNLLGMTHN